MHEEPSPGRGRHSAGQYALGYGLVALVCAVIPVIGDFIAAPIAVLAIVYGVIGVSRFDAGTTSKVLAAATGTALGTIALFVIVVAFIVTGPFP